MPAVMNRSQRRAAQKHMRKESATYPAHLVEVPRSEWPQGSSANHLQVWRSREYLVQVFKASEGCVCRLSINRTALTGNGWSEDIPWTELQRLKGECGFGQHDAVEVYPSDKDVVNVAAMRHLWIMADPLTFAWRNKS